LKKINNEDVLWERLRSGGLDALGSLYDLYIDELFSYGIQVSSDKAYVMDCIHDLFLDLYKYRKSLSSTNNVKYYLLRSLKNKILKKNKSKTIYLPDEDFHKKNINQNYSESFEESIINKEFLEEKELKLSNAISFLSKKQKQGLYLRFNEGKSYEDIAKIMSVSIQTSRTIVYRAIKELRKHLTLLVLIYKYFF